MLNACDMQGRRAVSGPSPSKQRETCKTAEKENVDIVAYSDIAKLVGLHVRRIYLDEKVEKKSLSFFQIERFVREGTRTKQILSHLYKDAPRFSRFFLLYSGGYYRELKIAINHEVYPAEGAYLYLWQASTMGWTKWLFQIHRIYHIFYIIRSCLCARKNFLPILMYLN